MNFESTLSNDEIIRSPDTSYVPDDTGDSGSDSISGDNVPAAPPISSIDVDDGKTTVVIVQQPAAVDLRQPHAAPDLPGVAAHDQLVLINVDGHVIEHVAHRHGPAKDSGQSLRLAV